MIQKTATRVPSQARARIKYYLMLLMRIEGTTVTQVSVGMGKHKSYVTTSLDTLNRDPMTKLLYNISSYIHVPYKRVMSVLDGDKKPLKKAQLKCAQKIGRPYLKKLCKRNHITNDDLKNRLPKKEYDDLVINVRPDLRTVLRLSKWLYSSAMALGTRFGYSKPEVKKAVDKYGHAINRRLVKLRHASGLNQTQVAKALGVYQTAVSGYEKQHYPHLSTIFKLAKLYHASPLSLAKLLPGYEGLELNSPAYKLLKLSVKQHLSNTELVKKANLSGYVSTYILRHEQKNADHMLDSEAKKLIKAFKLPKDYFGKTVPDYSHRLDKYKKRAKKIGMKPNYFGYKIAVGMIKRGITLRDLAKRTGLTYQRIQQITRYKTQMPTKALNRKLVDALNSFD